MRSEVTNTKYPAKTLPRLTPGQVRSVRRLTRQCCNNDNGNCLLLDDGDPCVYPQTISYSLICKHFRRGVLPLEPELEDAILRPKGTRRCKVCGACLMAGSGRAKYCAECAAEYSNIGINKIDSMLRAPKCPFVLFVGTKKLVKRKEFEQYISSKLVI